jgi:glycosyltransferase involved in cell wall biosynthesis
MKVLLLSRYGRMGASSRIRSYQYLPYLQGQGIEVEVAPLFSDDYLKQKYQGQVSTAGVFRCYLQRLQQLLRARKFDVLWIEKELFPWLPALAEQLLSLFKVPYVVDYDDAIFHRYDLHRRKLIRQLLGNKLDQVMRGASLVIAGNSYLAERAERTGARWVEILPTVIDLARYEARPAVESEAFVIGWIGSPINTPYLKLIEPALTEICRDHQARLLLVGADSIELKGVPIEHRSWSEADEVVNILDFDVGIMPLPDTPWSRGKCGYKLIQYMACGRPVVGSRIGANIDVVEPGVNGFLADSMDEWVDVLSRLRNDRQLRIEQGAAGRRRVEQHYCTARTAPKLAGLLQRLIEYQSA